MCHEALGSCLSLGRAGICDAGMMFLAPTLHRPHGMLSRIDLSVNSFGDKGLIALAPALRQLPALERLTLGNNRFGDEGLAALVPPPALPVGALPPPSGVLTKLTELDLSHTQVSDAGCATLAIAIGSGALHGISIDLAGPPASTAAKAAVQEALSSVSTTE